MSGGASSEKQGLSELGDACALDGAAEMSAEQPEGHPALIPRRGARHARRGPTTVPARVVKQQPPRWRIFCRLRAAERRGRPAGPVAHGTDRAVGPRWAYCPIEATAIRYSCPKTSAAPQSSLETPVKGLSQGRDRFNRPDDCPGICVSWVGRPAKARATRARRIGLSGG